MGKVQRVWVDILRNLHDKNNRLNLRLETRDITFLEILIGINGHIKVVCLIFGATQEQ